MFKHHHTQSFLAYGLVLLGVIVFFVWTQLKDESFIDRTNPSESPDELARFQVETGSALLKKFRDSEWKKQEVGEKGFLKSLDQLQTVADSSSFLTFASGYQLRLGDKTRVIVEIVRSERDYSILLHLLSGTLEVLKKGNQGQLLVQTGRRKVPPEELSNLSPSLWRSDIKNKSESVPEMSRLDRETSEPPSKPTADIQIKPMISGSSETQLKPLSNLEMDQQLAKQQSQFEKCQLNAIRDQEPSIGELLFGMTVSPDGRVSDVRVLATDIPDGAFLECIKSVIERTQFRPFPPPEIIRSYPLIFE